MSTLQNPSYTYSYNGSPYGWSINQFNQNTFPYLNQMQFNAGLATYNSSNPQISAVGNDLLTRSSSYNGSPAGTNVTPTNSGQSKFAQKGGWQALGQASDALSGLFAGDKKGYQGEYGDLQQAGDQAFDAASDAVMAINPLVGGIMKAGGLASDILTAYGGMGTDSMTKTDAILGSKLLSLTPFGMINGWGGTKTQKFNKDMQVFETIGSSYTGSEDMANDALSKANKKYGLFSSRQRGKADQMIAEAKRQQNIMADIADEASDRFNIRNSMSAINGNRRAYYLQGGYNQANVRVGKNGMSVELITKAKAILSHPKKMQKGDSVINITHEPTEILLVNPNEIPEFQEGGQINTKPRTLQELIEYAKEKNPRFVQRMSEPPRGIDFIDDKGNQVRGSHYMEWSTDDSGNAIVYPRIQEVGEELKFFSGPDAYKRAIENKNYLIMTPQEAETFFAKDPKYGTAYKSGWPQFFNKFQQGGSINVIPDGALHAHKHNMDMEGITKKGIPVVSNEEGGEQQAEIEREEIIFRLEVTKRLEELEKKFYSEDASQKEKDEYALEAGKLLVEEILYNTQDNTNRLL